MDVILENLTNILERSGYEIGFPGSVAWKYGRVCVNIAIFFDLNTQEKTREEAGRNVVVYFFWKWKLWSISF